MRINVKRKAHRKDCTLTMSSSKTCNLIIAHSVLFVKYKKPSEKPKNNYELIKSFDLNQMAHFLVNFRKILGMVDSVELAEKILKSEAVI